MTNEMGWMYPYHSMLQPLFDKYMLELYQSGTVDRIVKYYDPETETCNEEHYQQITIDFVLIAFICLWIGIGASIVIIILEKCGVNALKNPIEWP